MTDPANPITSRLVGVPRNPSLRRFLDFWLAHIAWAQLRYATARTYASVVAHHIGPVLGRVKVADLTATHLEQAKVVWTRAGVTDSMRRKAIEVLRSALRHAVALGVCETNPASRVTVPRLRKVDAKWLDVADAKRVLESARGHSLEAGYALAIGLGLRRGEVVGLTWADVDLAKKVLHVRWNRTEWHQGTRLTEPKTAASRRALALPSFVAEVLERQLVRERAKAQRAGVKLQPNDPVLTSRTRKPIWSSYLHVEFKTRLRKLGLPPMRYHDLRHTAASMLLASGVSPRTVMEMLGHRNLEVTMFVYGHVNLRHQREAADALDRAMGGHCEKEQG
jgi:integrase